MSSAQRIKQLFAKSNITVSSKVDDRIVRDALMAFDSSEDKKSISAGAHPGRTTMKVRIAKFAAAAVVIIALLIGLNYFGGSPDIAGVTWGEVARKVEEIQMFSYRIKLVAQAD